MATLPDDLIDVIYQVQYIYMIHFIPKYMILLMLPF